MRKLSKLTRMDLGLDIEAYKDYVNNLKKFAHLNYDFQLFAQDSLRLDQYSEYNQLIKITDDDGKGSSTFSIDSGSGRIISSSIRSKGGLRN